MRRLGGRGVEIGDITVVRPRIAVTVDPDGYTNWSPLIGILARALKPDAERAERVLSFSGIGIKDGVVALRVPDRNVAETLNGVELSLAWPSIARSCAASGHCRSHNS